MKQLMYSPLHLVLSQGIGFGIGGWLQFHFVGQIGMLSPLGMMLLFCFIHQFILAKRQRLPKMPEEIKSYVLIALMWSGLMTIGYGYSQYYRLEEVWIVLPILLAGVTVMDVIILLCCQEIVSMIVSQTRERDIPFD